MAKKNEIDDIEFAINKMRRSVKNLKEEVPLNQTEYDKLYKLL